MDLAQFKRGDAVEYSGADCQFRGPCTFLRPGDEPGAAVLENKSGTIELVHVNADTLRPQRYCADCGHELGINEAGPRICDECDQHGR